MKLYAIASFQCNVKEVYSLLLLKGYSDFNKVRPYARKKTMEKRLIRSC